MFGIYSEHSTQTRTSPHNCRPPAVNVTHFAALLQPRIALLQPRCPSASTATARMQRVLHAQCICCPSSPVIPRLPMSSPPTAAAVAGQRLHPPARGCSRYCSRGPCRCHCGCTPRPPWMRLQQPRPRLHDRCTFSTCCFFATSNLRQRLRTTNSKSAGLMLRSARIACRCCSGFLSVLFRVKA